MGTDRVYPSKKMGDCCIAFPQVSQEIRIPLFFDCRDAAMRQNSPGDASSVREQRNASDG